MPTAFWSNLVGAVQVVPEAQWLIDAPAKAWSVQGWTFPTANSVHVPTNGGGGGVAVRFEAPDKHWYYQSALPGDRPAQLRCLVVFDTPWHTGDSWSQQVDVRGNSYSHGGLTLNSSAPDWPADGGTQYEQTITLDWSHNEDLLSLEFGTQPWSWFGYTLSIEKLY